MRSVTAHDEFHDVLDQNDRRACLLKHAQASVERVHFLQVHAGGGLVQQQEPRLGGERPGQLEAALLAECEVGGELIPLVGQTGEGELFIHCIARCAGAEEPSLREILSTAVFDRILRHPKVLPDRKVAEQADVLKRARHARRQRPVRLCAGDVAILEHDPSAGDRQDAADQIDRGALARAVGADQAEDLALLDREIQLIDGTDTAEMLAEGFEFQYRHWPSRE